MLESKPIKAADRCVVFTVYVFDMDIGKVLAFIVRQNNSW